MALNALARAGIRATLIQDKSQNQKGEQPTAAETQASFPSWNYAGYVPNGADQQLLSVDERCRRVG